MQPRAQRAGVAQPQRARTPHQDQEGGLERVLGGVAVAEDLAADRQHGRPVAGQDRLEGRLGLLGTPPIPTRRREPLEELAVAQPDRAAGAEELPQVPAHVARRSARHARPLDPTRS